MRSELNEPEYNLLVDQATTAIVVIDVRRTVVVFNPQAEQLFGLPSDQVLGRPIECLIPKRFWDAHRVAVQAFLEEPFRRPMGIIGSVWAAMEGGGEMRVRIELTPIVANGELLVVAAVESSDEDQE